MRLINATTLQLEEFIGSQPRPAYAILSHRWVYGEEVSFQDFHSKHRRWIPGWAKIQFCCAQAVVDGLDYAWVDTCCIDKDSSSELSEAINSMYEWYANADTCYAYLNDVFHDHLKFEEMVDKITASAWFTRAWTLQELLAPRNVMFYNAKFLRLCSKSEIAQKLGNLLKIPHGVLLDPKKITLYPVAVRMSWSANRQATRVEDHAYSLFGLFQVNLPLLYGEGERSFTRLQEEIIKQSHDHSIFTWTPEDGDLLSFGSAAVFPLLAPSPNRFRDLNSIWIRHAGGQIRPYHMTNIGLQIELQVTPYYMNVYAALLDCSPELQFQYALLLTRESVNSTRFYRAFVQGQSMIKIRTSKEGPFRWENMRICRMPAAEQLRGGLLSHEIRSQLAAQFYGIRIQAPKFLHDGNGPRTYALVAYHDWEINREFVRTEAHPMTSINQQTSQAENQLRPLSNIELKPSAREVTRISNLSAALDRALGRNKSPGDSDKMLRSTSGIENFNQAPASEKIPGPTASIHSISERKLTPLKDPLKDEESDLLLQKGHIFPYHRDPGPKPVGTLMMPVLSTGTAGVIYFDQPVHGIKCIKVGFDFDFRPVLFVATQEAETDLEIQRWLEKTRYVNLRKFHKKPSQLDKPQEKSARNFWQLQPDDIRDHPRLDVSDDGVTRLSCGIYAFYLPEADTTRDSWAFKPFEQQAWYLSVQIVREFRNQELYWEVTLDWHEEQLQITVDVV